LVCSDCNSVSHEKKRKYFLEYFLPRKYFQRILPSKAFLRLFSDRGEVSNSKFYDSYVPESKILSDWRLSEWNQLIDTLNYFHYDWAGKRILDVSGGPGYVGKKFNDHNDTHCLVTEYSEESVDEIQRVFNIPILKFDYNSDSLECIIDQKFDLILLRSSIIFCSDLRSFIHSVSRLLNPGGCVLLESITPTMGEILWWQTLEYKFPHIPSQTYVERVFCESGLYFRAGFREYGNYLGVKSRSYKGVAKNLFVWLVDYPMVLVYRLFAKKNRVAIDQKMTHKMLFQFWQKDPIEVKFDNYRNFHINQKNMSFHFGQIYNGYLRQERF
jgi:2-polyprenyl-3-methyl-5-hydroxy-6-metoxy-1,4-benzoquinol methylase